MAQHRTAKSQYSETEAAAVIGVSVDQLRTLIRQHVTVPDEAGEESKATTFQPSDLVLLRILARQAPVQAAQVN